MKTILLWTTHFYIPKIKLDYSANAKVKPPKINPLKGNGYEILVFSNANAEKKNGERKRKRKEKERAFDLFCYMSIDIMVHP